LRPNPADSGVDLVSSVTLPLEELFGTSVERPCLWPIEKPSESVCFRKQGFRILRSVRILQKIDD
jgi:hypothetical protein